MVKVVSLPGNEDAETKAMVSFCEPYMRKGRLDERDAERLGRSYKVIECCADEVTAAS